MDRGWTVAAAASLTAFFTVPMMMNSGFFYVSFMEEFNVNRETASWPASVMSGVSHSFCLLVCICQRRMSVFHMGLAGSIFLWAGILGAVFAPNMIWMTVAMGGVHGAGIGIVCVTLVIVVMMYFDKYRGIASGLKFAGYTLCSLLYPVILTSLKETYGVRGALLVFASITMNVTALTLLLKEPPWYTNGRKMEKSKPTRPVFDSSPDKTNAIQAGSCPIMHERTVERSSYCSKYSNKDTHSPTQRPVTMKSIYVNACSDATDRGTATLPDEPTYHRTKTFDEKCSVTQKAWMNHTGYEQPTTAENKESNLDATGQRSESPSAFRHIVHLLSIPRFYVVVLGVVAIDYTIAVFPATIVDYALDKGSARHHADLSVTYCAPAELIGRIVLPMVGDCRVVSRTTLVSATFFLLAASMLALPVTTSFVSYILVCACATMMTGCLMSMKPVVIADYFGIESVAASWGIAGVTLLPLLMCSPSIIGFFRDTIGTYDGLYQLQAGIHCCVGGLFGILAFMDWRGRK